VNTDFIVVASMLNKKITLSEKELNETLNKIHEASNQFDDVCTQLQSKLQQMELQQKFLILLEEKVKANSILITKLYSQHPEIEKKESKIEGYS